MNLYKIVAAIAMVLALVGSSLADKDATAKNSGKLIMKPLVKPLIKVHVIKPHVKKAPSLA